jgi:hypothetical protein
MITIHIPPWDGNPNTRFVSIGLDRSVRYLATADHDRVLPIAEMIEDDVRQSFKDALYGEGDSVPNGIIGKAHQ